MAWIDCLSGYANHNNNFHLNKTLYHFCINTPSKCSQYPGVFITSPFRMFPDFWTSDSVFRRMIVQLRRTAFLNKIYSPRGVDFCPLSLKAVWRPPLFYFISWVYIYWITSAQTFTKIWEQVLFGWNDLKAHANGRNKCQQLPTLLGVVGQQCCVHLHEPKSLTNFKLYTTSDNKCQHCCGFIQTDATSHNIVGPTMLGVGGQQCWVSFA